MQNISIKSLQILLVKLFAEVGFSKEDAIILSTSIIDAEMSDSHCHGFRFLIDLIDGVTTNRINKEAHINGLHKNQCYHVVDCNRGIGNLYALKMINHSIELSEKFGISVIFLKNFYHWGRAGYYTSKAAMKNMIAISMSNTMPVMPMYGSTVRNIGNNVLAISIPSRNEEPITFDMCTSIVSVGHIIEILKKEKSINKKIAIDKKGKTILDPLEILNTGAILPLADYKGSGLAFMIEVITTILSGGEHGFCMYTEKLDSPIKPLACAMLITIDICKFCNIGEYKDRLANLINYINNSDLTSDNSVLLPGDKSKMARKKAQENGLSISFEVKNLFLKYGIDYESDLQ